MPTLKIAGPHSSFSHACGEELAEILGVIGIEYNLGETPHQTLDIALRREVAIRELVITKPEEVQSTYWETVGALQDAVYEGVRCYASVVWSS